MNCLPRFVAIAILIIAGRSLSATELYNIGFSKDDVGTYQVVSGNPSVQRSVSPFTDALVFRAVGGSAGGDEIRLPLPAAESRYDIQFDVVTHNLLNSQHAFVIYLDNSENAQLYFHGGLNSVRVFQSSPYTLGDLLPFSDDQAYHFDLSVNLPASRWSVAVDGAQLFENPISTSSLGGIDFRMTPWIVGAVDAPGTYAALDNVVVNEVPEPSVFVLLTVAGLAVAAFAWIKRNGILLKSDY